MQLAEPGLDTLEYSPGPDYYTIPGGRWAHQQVIQNPKHCALTGSQNYTVSASEWCLPGCKLIIVSIK